MTQASQHIHVRGAGIMGLSTAYAALKAGYRVSVSDPAGFPNTNSASYIAGGMLAPYSEIDLMSADFIEAGLRSIDIWQSIAHDLNIEFQNNGSLFIAHTEDQHMLGRFEQHLPNKAYQAIKPQDREPNLPSKFGQALYLPQEAAIHPQQCMQALCDYLQKQDNVTLKTSADHNADWIIDCTGIATAEHDEQLRGVKGEIAIVQNPDFELSHTVRMMHPRYPLYIVPRSNNIFMIGATQIESSADTTVSLRSAMELLSALYSLHPSFADAKILNMQAGIRPAYTDNHPRITREDNTIYCNGLFRHGYLLSPVIAQSVLSMIEGESASTLFMKDAA